MLPAVVVQRFVLSLPDIEKASNSLLGSSCLNCGNIGSDFPKCNVHYECAGRNFSFLSKNLSGTIEKTIRQNDCGRVLEFEYWNTWSLSRTISYHNQEALPIPESDGTLHSQNEPCFSYDDRTENLMQWHCLWDSNATHPLRNETNLSRMMVIRQ